MDGPLGYCVGFALVLGPFLLLAIIFVYDGLWSRPVAVGNACPGCGYDLTGIVERRQCPECGSRFRLEEDTVRFRHLRNPVEVAVGVVLLLIIALVAIATFR